MDGLASSNITNTTSFIKKFFEFCTHSSFSDTVAIVHPCKIMALTLASMGSLHIDMYRLLMLVKFEQFTYISVSSIHDEILLPVCC